MCNKKSLNRPNAFDFSLMEEMGVLTVESVFIFFPFEFTSSNPVYLASTKWIWVALSIDKRSNFMLGCSSCEDGSMVNLKIMFPK